MKTKLTIDNLDLNHSVTFEKMSEMRGDFDAHIPPIQPLNTAGVEPMLFSHLDQLFGIKRFFKAFSSFSFPKNFGRLRFLFGFRVIPKICPTVCLELIQDAVALDPSLEKEGQLLSACFEEIQEKEDLLRAITLKIRSCQKS